MSNTLSSVAVTEFDSMVKHAYQGVGKLKGAVTVRNNVVGDTYKFRKMGKGQANQKGTSDLVVPMGVDHSLATATLSNYHASEYTDLFDAAEVNFDEKQELATTIAGALGRRLDQLVIDALNGASLATTAQGGTADSDALTVDTLASAKVELVKQGVGDSALFGVINAAGLEDMLQDAELTSSDYNSVKALVNGDVNSFMGFNFIVIEDRDEGGLTVSGNTADSFFFSQDAVGLAIGIDMKTTIDYIPERTSHLCTGMLKAGACVRDTAGVVKVQYHSA